MRIQTLVKMPLQSVKCFATVTHLWDVGIIHPASQYCVETWTSSGILKAARKHKNDKEVELASAKMLALDIKRVFHFESILKRKTWQTSDDEKLLLPELNPGSENIRGNEYYH